MTNTSGRRRTKFKDVHKAREQRDQKVKQLRRRQNLRLAAALTILVVVLAGSISLYTSDFWRIRRVEVVGGSHISRSRVLGLARIPGTASLLRFPGDTIAARITKENWVKSVEFSRRLPGTLIINISERRPVATISLGAKRYVIDRSLFVITNRQATETVSLPVIKDLLMKRPLTGRRLHSTAVETVVSVMEGLPPKLRSQITTSAVPSISKLTIYTKDNVEIVYGPAREMKKKNYIIESILKKNDSKIIYINVTVPGNPVVRKVQKPIGR